MTKSVLLARPHPFLVSDMKPWLEAAGFVVRRSDTPQELHEKGGSCVGAVISLAVTSPIGLSAEEVFQILRLANPSLPILFAALRPFDQAQVEVERLSKKAGTANVVVNLGAGAEKSSRPEISSSILYVAKDDLIDPTRRLSALAQLKQYFL